MADLSADRSGAFYRIHLRSKMPQARVDDAGNVLYYEDSGAPPTGAGVYTTIVVIHGFVFHSGASFTLTLVSYSS